MGGSVRDLLMHPDTPPGDVDIATNAPFDAVTQLFPGTLAIGKAFGVGLTKHNEFTFEVATFRKESDYTDRRHPSSVGPGTMEEDSARRDFTINALYFDPIAEQILDFHNGLVDLQKRQLRCVGDALVRLHEDPLRILRLYRFAANLALSIEAKTHTAAENLSSELTHISKERVFLEIAKLKPHAVHEFSNTSKRAQQVLLRTPSGMPDILTHVSQTAWTLPHEALQFPGSVFALMCLRNLKLTPHEWQTAFAQWPLSVKERAQIEFVSKHLCGEFNLSSSSNAFEDDEQWQQWLEGFKWISRQNRITLGEAIWLAESVAEENNASAKNTVILFCQKFSQTHSTLGLADALEQHIGEQARSVRHTLNAWAEGKPPAVLGRARLLADASLFLDVLNYSHSQRPPYLQVRQTADLGAVCDEAIRSAKKTNGKKNARRSP